MSDTKLYNCFGEVITGTVPQLADPSYGKDDGTGNIVPAWKEANDSVDSMGFDKGKMQGNGYYKQEVILPKGTRLCRYGAARGKMTTNAGIPYENAGASI